MHAPHKRQKQTPLCLSVRPQPPQCLSAQRPPESLVPGYFAFHHGSNPVPTSLGQCQSTDADPDSRT